MDGDKIDTVFTAAYGDQGPPALGRNDLRSVAVKEVIQSGHGFGALFNQTRIGLW